MNKLLLVLLGCLLFSVARLSAQTCLTSNLAAGKTVKASTLQTDAHNVTDGNLTTEWQPTVGGAQWIYVDLGQSYTVCKVILKWTTWASDDHWSIYLTNDTTSWGTYIFNNNGTVTTQAAGDAYSYHTADLSGSSASGRYLRISFSNMTAWNARLDEIEVYNKVPLVLPSVSLTAPLDGANYTEGDSITFTATATEAGGTISKVEFFQGSTKIGEDATSPYSFTWTHVPEGEYLITAKATDAVGGSSASTAINVFVDFPDPAWSRTGNTHTTDSNFLGTTDSTRLVLRTKNIKRMTFLPNGNIGIGVDTPTAALHVKGNLRLDSYKSPDTTSSYLSTDTSGIVRSRKLVFGQGLSRIGDTVGLVGGYIDLSKFGTPRSLDVNLANGTDSTARTVLSYSGNYLVENVVNDNSISSRVVSARHNEATFNINSSIDATPSYNAGIFGYAYNTPGNNTLQLYVSDSLGGTGITLYDTGIDFSAKNIEFYQFPNDASESKVLTTDSTGRLKLKSISGLGGSSNWKLTGSTAFDTTNSIGIGTNNTQGYKLAVNGDAIFTKIKVKTHGSWPDYVFEKNYRLPALSDLERYVKKYKHLPGVSSADQVAKAGGFDVAGNQAALLKKVEELTLYIIDQNKEIQMLKEENKKLTDLQRQIDELKKLLQPKN